MTSEKQSIIVAHGHLYLFWSLGVYYTAELAHKYSVILLVPEEYRQDGKFQAVCKYLIKVLKVIEIFLLNYQSLVKFTDMNPLELCMAC